MHSCGLSFIAEESAMFGQSLEQRVAALEGKVAAIEEHLRLKPEKKSILSLFDGPPPTPEEQAAWDEVQHFMREARRADLAEFDREALRERCDPGEV
jgi:hypothetical protein